MKLAISKEGAATGAAAGALAGFFLAAFGLREILGGVPDADIVLYGLALGFLVGLVGGRWVMLAISGLLAVTYFVIGNTPIMGRVAAKWVRSDPLPASADAIVVLSATVLADTTLNVEGTERLLSGLELFERGISTRLFTTKVEVGYPQGVLTSIPDQQRLVKLANAQAGWTVLQDTHSTRDEALQAAVKLPNGARSIVVVTSPMHTRRACATFEAVGFKVTCYPARTREHGTWTPVDTADRLAAFADYLYERLGMIKYRWKHWLPADT